MSILNYLSLPTDFGKILLLFSLILSISPFLNGADFGIFRIPAFPPRVNDKLKIIGPIMLIIAIVLHVPFLGDPIIKEQINFWDKFGKNG